jgi:DNA-binding XRE family transcriptional regulator
MKNHWLSGGQIRAARALLRWSVEQLAQEASLGRNTIKRAEAKDGKTSLTTANELALGRVFEAAGVEFTNGEQPGVRLTKVAAAHSGEPASASNPTVAAKAARRKTAKATEKKR